MYKVEARKYNYYTFKVWSNGFNTFYTLDYNTIICGKCVICKLYV